MVIEAQWSYSPPGKKAIHEAGHVAVALCLGIEIGAVTVEEDHEGGGFAEVRDDWVNDRKPESIENRAVVVMAGIASDVLFGRNHSMPSSDSSWDAIYCAEESWRPDICRCCCLDWISRHTDILLKVATDVPHDTSSDGLLAMIRGHHEYQAPPRDCVRTYFNSAKALLGKPKVRDFTELLGERLSSLCTLSSDQCRAIWRDSGCGGVE
jgi:hypothetical protein